MKKLIPILLFIIFMNSCEKQDITKCYNCLKIEKNEMGVIIKTTNFYKCGITDYQMDSIKRNYNVKNDSIEKYFDCK